jgi:trehalose 6-phosphate phosphatase
MTDQTAPMAVPAALPLPVPPPPQADWALFLDIDGTLLDLAAAPDAVRVPADLRAALQAVAARLDGALALVSGRSIATIDRLFDPLRLAVSGQHGSEWRPAPDAPVQAVAARPLPAAVDTAVAAIGRRHTGILVERKSHALAVHYRQTPAAGAEIGAQLARAIAGLDGLMLMPGQCVWEIKDATRSKGTAVAHFLTLPTFQRRRPVFVGDDRTDEDGFRVVEQQGGHAFAVGALALQQPQRPGFATPDDVRRWLGDFAKGAGA